MKSIENAPGRLLGNASCAPGNSPRTRSLLDVLADTVARHEGRIAIDAFDATLTYAQLSDAADRVAAELRGAGVGPGDRVGVRLPSGSSSLYVGILGVLRSGGAYVPVDYDDPDARAETIWESAKVYGTLQDELSFIQRRPCSGRPFGDVAREPTAGDDAWIIFTSGSTGRPKGVAVSHRAAAAFVDAEAQLWTVLPEDRVLAGLSVSFDASCEEMWLAWANGAALVPAPRALMRTGVDLGPWLTGHDVNVISTVPTLAAMWDEAALTGVRLLILGGEPCPPDLGWRLAGKREVWNTYGPTEATVVSTATCVHPGVPVTIGWPLAGWMVAVVDGADEPVALGETGELIIGGVGLGRYLDAQLDAERYAAMPALGWERGYRSGDLVRETVHGLEFVGRRDQQVKLAGRRLELGEVEAQLQAVNGVRAAAVAVQTTTAANKILVGYVVGDVDPEHVRAQVAEQLPDGLAPLVVVLDSLPMATSGKVDRAALPWPLAPTLGVTTDAAALSGTAAWLAERWAEQLGPLAFTVDADFFELGGTSVAAAKLVSSLRSRFPSVAVADVYEQRSLVRLSERLDALGEGRREVASHRAIDVRGGRAAQLAGVFLLLMFTVPAWLAGIFAYNDLFDVGIQLAWPALVTGYLLFISAPGRTLIVVVARRLLLSDLKPGRYPRHSWMACRVWFIDRLAEVLHVNRVGGTPWAPRLARLLGAEIGAGVRLGTLPSPASLIRIGDGATLEGDVDVHGWWVQGPELVVGELKIGRDARVGTRVVLMPGAEIGDGAEIEPGSVVTSAIPAGERWAGTPARRVDATEQRWPREHPPDEPHRRFWKAMFGVGLFGINALTLAAAVPALLLVDTFNPSSSIVVTAMTMALGAPLLAASFILSEAVLSALLFRLVSRMVKPGWHADTGGVAWALWFGEQVMESARTFLFPLYATVYTRSWLRLHGLDVGKRTEVSTAQGLNRLVSMGETTFVADAPMFATARAHRGWIHLERISVGSGTFIGNGALLAGGTTVGDDSLIGIESTAPRHAPDGTSWFGGPPIELPRAPERTDPSRTTEPPRRLVLARATTELVRILLPDTVSIVLGTLVLMALDSIGAAVGTPALVVAAPFVVLAAALCAVLFTIAMKWLIIGRYRPSEHPLWSFFVWRDEIVNSCQEQLAGDWLMNMAQGTALMPAYLRAMGADIGHDVWCETLAVTEFDVVTVGDGCAINRGACLETHLFQDRLMRIGPNHLGAGSTLGPHSATLPDTRLGSDCVVGGRSVVLRGEELPASTRWHGVPVVGV